MQLFRFTAAVAFTGFLLGAAPKDQKAPDATKSQSQVGSPARLAGFADTATFHLYSNEDRLASQPTGNTEPGRKATGLSSRCVLRTKVSTVCACTERGKMYHII